MADRTLRAVITGSSAGAVKAFQETALAADSATKTVGDKFETAGGHISGVFSKLAGLTQNIPIVGTAFQDLSDKFSEVDGSGKNLSGAMADLGKVSLVAGAAALAGVGAESIKLATSFQTTTTSIASNAGITLKAAQGIGNAFLDTAGKSVFSGQEIGAAYAAVAGQLGATEGHALSASQALAVMKAAGDLAEASGQSLSSSTSSLANVMQAFGLKTSQAASVSDTLYNASRLTGSGIDTLTSTFDRVHSKLGDLSPSLGTLSGLLVDMTEHGVTGRAAVTALSGAFTGLAAPTAKVTAAQQALGVSFINSKTGALDPMSSIISKLQPIIAGMGNAQATATLKSIGFGTASTALVNIIKAGPSAFDAATASVNKTGSAADAARLKSGTLHDQMETLKATAEDLGTKFGDVLIPILEKLGSAISDVIGWLLQHKVALIAVAAVIGGVVVVAIGMFVASLFTAEGALAFIMGPIGLVIAAVALLAAGAYLIVSNWSTIASFLTGLWNDVYNNVFAPIVNFFTVTVPGALDTVVGFFTALPGRIVTGLGDIVGTIWSGLKTAATWVYDNVISPVFDYFKGLPDKIVAGLGDIASTIFAGILNMDMWLGTHVGIPIINFFTSLPTKITNVAVGMWDGVSDAFKDAINTIIGWWDDLHFKVPGFSIGPIHFGGFDLGMPSIPKLAAGGIVPATPGGMLAVLGEGGQDEAVVPLPSGGGSSGTGGDYYDFSRMTIVANDPQTLVNQLKVYMQQNGSLASAGVR